MLPLCPSCLAARLQALPSASLQCPACKALIPAPSPRAAEPAHPSERSTPTWEADARLYQGQWDRYSRPGGLVQRYGRSTQRAPWTPSAGFDPAREERPPAVQREAITGDADAALDALIAAETATVQRFADTLRALGRPRRAPAKPTIAALLLAHCDAAAPPTLLGVAIGAGPLARALVQGFTQGAALLMANALLRRGVDVWALLGRPDGGPVEPVPVRTPRTHRWSGVAHVMAVADAAPALAPSGRGPDEARPKHATPTGLAFGVMAVRSQAPHRASAPGEGAVIETLDARAVLSRLSRADVALLAASRASQGPEARGRRAGASKRLAAALREAGMIPPAPSRAQQRPRPIAPPAFASEAAQ